MNTRFLLTATAATGLAMGGAAAASAQDASPATYQDIPVVQPLPARMSDAGAQYEVEEVVRTVAPVSSYPETYASVPQQGPVHAPVPVAHRGYTTTPIQFDREGWLAECRAQYGDGKKKGGILGSLLGAIAGGVIGNRVYDSERLAGTLIGAGVGGIAGLAIGSAIGGSGERRRTDECEATLDRYLAGGYGQQYAGYPGYGYAQGGHSHSHHHDHASYGYQQQVRMIPVSVPVQQRAVIREYVTYETYMDTETSVERVPQEVERVRYIKDRPAPQPVKRVPVPQYVKDQ